MGFFKPLIMEWIIKIIDKPKQRIVINFNSLNNRLDIYGRLSINGHSVDMVYRAVSLNAIRTVTVIDGNSSDYFTEFDNKTITENITSVYNELQKRVEDLNGLNELFSTINEIGIVSTKEYH